MILAGLAGSLGAALLLAGHLASAQPQAAPVARPAPSQPSGGLTAFASETELRQFLQRLRQRQRRGAVTVGDQLDDLPQVLAAPPAPAAQAEGMVAVTGARVATPSITNTQEADVDEGGIVKVRGDTLVILRRGRLFTVSLAGGGMRPIDSINAFPPGVSGRGDWYDEMLLSGNRVIVVGYSYSRGGTEINRFRLDAAGRLRFEDAYHLKSNDYYSSRNYASRLIGNRLVFYTPLYLGWSNDPLEVLPGIRKWEPGAARDRRFRPIARPSQIFVSPAMRDDGNSIQALHSVVSCDLLAAELDCSATGVLGPASRTFYVSSGAVYLWVADSWSRRRGRSGDSAALFRLPFGREHPSAIAAEGMPVDQFSFREDRGDGMINVLLRKEGRGDAMGGPEVTGGGVALLRLPLSDFGDGSQSAPASRYRLLPRLPGQNWSFQNRFVGNHVLYGGGTFGAGGKARVVVAPVRGGAAVELDLDHAVGRIEALGSDALVVGSGARADLGFTAIELPRRGPARLGDVYTLPAASEGETRSHAFFFRPTTPDGSSGILGLPVARPVESAYRRFFGSAASMLFLRRDDRRFSPAGELEAQVRGVVDDSCQASCVDWYGNARPIFLGDRIFALLGYELVEGRLARGAIREVGRTNFSPGRRGRMR
jgi:hypothetical protein